MLFIRNQHWCLGTQNNLELLKYTFLGSCKMNNDYWLKQINVVGNTMNKIFKNEAIRMMTVTLNERTVKSSPS